MHSNPSLMIAKQMASGASLIQVQAYAIRHKNHISPTFEINTVLSDDNQVVVGNVQDETGSWGGLSRSARTLAATIRFFQPDIERVFGL